MIRRLSWIILILAICSLLGELCGLHLPTISWPFEASQEIAFLHTTVESSSPFVRSNHFLWFGWLTNIILIGLSIKLLCYPKDYFIPTPLNQRRWARFKTINRGYISLKIILILAFIACLDQTLVGKRPLLLSYEGHWFSPALVQKQYTGADFGLKGEEADSEPNYRKLKATWDQQKSKNFVIMPLVPFDPTGDSTLPPIEKLSTNELGQVTLEGKPYSGLASTFYNQEDRTQHLRFRLRKGIKDGPMIGWLPNKDEVYSAQYKKGTRVKENKLNESLNWEEFFRNSDPDLYIVHYHPAPPMKGNHWLGTTSQGTDITAYLFGGLQVNFKAALFFLPIVYFIGISLGLMMGYYGGWFDLIFQRFIEIFSEIPFLLVIIIISSMLPLEWRGLPLILTILIVFSWMGMTYQLRTSAMKEKTRDYVSAARIMGASTPRILFLHILPNLVAIIVTLIPFSVSSLILSLASLDYLGFGLPVQYASWGRLLNDGLAYLSCPWIVSASFFALVMTLLLVTFVGEAIREAFDPKKFTTYK